MRKVYGVAVITSLILTGSLIDKTSNEEVCKYVLNEDGKLELVCEDDGYDVNQSIWCSPDCWGDDL